METGVRPSVAARRWLDRPVMLALPAIALLWITSWRSLFDPGLWFDEAYSVDFANRPFGELWSLITQSEAQMSGWHLFLKVWLVANDSDAWARLPSLLAMSAGLAVLAVLADRVVRSRAIVLAATICVASFPDLRWYAVDARGYALSIALVLLSILLATESGPAPTRLKLRPVAMGVTVGLASTINAITLVVFVPLAIAVVVSPDRVRNIGRLALSALVAGLILVPFVRPFLSSRQADWIQPVPRLDWVENLSNTPVWVDRALMIAAIFVCISGLLGLFRGDRVRDGDYAASGGVVLLIGLMGLIPLFVVAVASDIARPLLLARYVSFSLPFLILGLVLLAHPWWARSTGWSAARVAVLTIAVIGVCWNLWPPLEQRRIVDEYRAASQFVNEQAKSTDLIVAYTVPNTLVRYGVDLGREVSPSTSRLWVISYHPVTVDQVRSTANQQGLAITSTDVTVNDFGSASVLSVPVRPMTTSASP